jgi:glycosyltransferase involved in cell wall biosynthesis
VACYLLVTGDFVRTGGMDWANHALATYLADRGDEIHLVTYRAAADLESRPNVTVHRVRKPLKSYMLAGPLLAREGQKLARQISARGGHVVVNGGNCDWPDINWVHHVHAADAPITGGSLPRRLKTRLAYRRHVAAEKRVIPKARLVITGCERSRTDLLERVGGDPSRVHAVYYGVDTQAYRPARAGEREATRERLGWPEGRPKVAFVGALADRRKGFDRLFAAWAELCRDPLWDADLVVVGRGAEVPTWKSLAEAEGLADRVTFLGFVPDLGEIYRACDAHCLPSRYEGYSLVTQEALACGIPAFITRASGISERYPETLRDLLIDDPEDVTDLVRRLRDWRSRMVEYRVAVQPLSETLRATTWTGMAARIAELAEA